MLVLQMTNTNGFKKFLHIHTLIICVYKFNITTRSSPPIKKHLYTFFTHSLTHSSEGKNKKVNSPGIGVKREKKQIYPNLL